MLSAFLPPAAADEPFSSSPSFTLLPAPAGTGGGSITNDSGVIRADISIGDSFEGGASLLTAGGIELKGGFTGQLYDAVGLGGRAEPELVDEESQSQLEADAVLDDDTLLMLDPLDAVWSVLSGPLTGITAEGLATAGIVFEDTTATVRGSWQDLEVDIGLTVLNVDDDDLPGYADDGIDDDWQVDFFGLDNPDAGPGENPDGDGHDNFFEFIAGLDPTDSSSVFELEIEHDADLGAADISFSPRLTDRTYRLLSADRPDQASWVEITGANITDMGDRRTMTDRSAGGTRKFYRVEIERE